MRRFCLRHLLLIFSFCFIATSSYVLFDLLDIDGSDFKKHNQVGGFEAVMPASSGESKPSAVEISPSWPEVPRTVLLTVSNLTSLAIRPVLPSISRYLIVHTRRAAQRESASLAPGNDPARRSV